MVEAKTGDLMGTSKLAEFRKRILTETLGVYDYTSFYSCFKKLFSDTRYGYVILKVRKTWSLYSAMKPIFSEDPDFSFNEAYIINDRVVDVFIDRIKDSIESGKKILLIDDCTNTGSTLSRTLTELGEYYNISFDDIVLHSFFVNSDIYSDGEGDGDKNCYFDVKNGEFRFYLKDLKKENKPFVKNNENARHSVKLYDPKLINFDIVSEVRRTSNMMLKAIHEGVSPYVSYLPCFFLDKNSENSELFEKVMNAAVNYELDLINNTPHDFVYVKDIKQKYYIIPTAENVKEFRKYIKISTADGAGYLYIAPYVFLPDDLKVEKLKLIYEALMGEAFPLSNNPDLQHRRLKHFLCILVFKEFCEHQLEYRIEDISACRFSILMAEIFGEFDISGKSESPYVKLVNASSLEKAERMIERILSIEDKYEYSLLPPPDDETKGNVKALTASKLKEAYDFYKKFVGK
jgi:hypothetical protein